MDSENRNSFHNLVSDAALAFIATVVIALILASLSAAGLITMSLSIILLVCAWLACIAGTFLPILNLGWRHRIIFSSLLGMALAVIGLVEFHYYERPATAIDFTRAIAGGDNVCYLEPVISNPKKLNEAVPIRLVNNGNGTVPRLNFLVSPYWIHGQANLYHDVHYSTMNRSEVIDECAVGARWLSFITPDGYKPFTLKPGRYRV